MNDLAILADDAGELSRLRAELDGLDDSLHDLLMQRAEVVQRVGKNKEIGRARGRLRPGREAAIVRRLLARHHGSLPPATVLRIWRELLAGTVSMQSAFSLAVCDADPARAYVQAAREHFGALTPLAVHASPLHAIGAVSAGAATLAILPMPREDEAARTAWWPALLHRDDPRMHVVGRLPFWSRRPDGAPPVEALAIAAMPPDASGDDRSLIGVELPPGMSRGRLAAELAEAGFAPGAVIVQREADICRALADVAGFIEDTEPRLHRLRSAIHRPVVLGAYAVPLI